MSPNFALITTPTLGVGGDQDDMPRRRQLTHRGADWLTEPYVLSPGRKTLLTLFSAQHSLGGINGYESTETTDDHPEGVALIQQFAWAYLHHALDIEHSSWTAAEQALAASSNPLCRS